MEIIYCSSDGVCKNNCIYCFSKTEKYQKNKSFYDLELGKKEYIIYPFCDDEISIDDKFLEKTKEITNIAKYIILSFSTKNILNKNEITKIKEIDNLLRLQNKGFIKISITVTNKSRVEELEKGTCDYNDRIKNLEILNKLGIKNSVIIKPFLPFIDISEYEEIISETIIFTKNFILGGLYFTGDSEIFDKYIKNNFSYKEKQLNWSELKQKYFFIESEDKQENLKKYIKEKGGNYFDGDVEFLLYIKNKSGNDL